MCWRTAGNPQKGKKAIENFIKNQLQKDLKGIENLKLKIKNLAIAYEPILGNRRWPFRYPGRRARNDKIHQKFLQTTNYKLQTKVLYGGSVDGKNIKNFVKYDEIDGFLIGHASLNKNEIKTIIKSI